MSNETALIHESESTPIFSQRRKKNNYICNMCGYILCAIVFFDLLMFTSKK